MATAVDRAREKWGLDKETPIVIDGSGDGQQYQEARKTVRGLMPQLVGLDGIVRKNTLTDLDSLLTSFGFKRIKEEPYNEPGRQIFYRYGRVMIRIKTKGNEPGEKYRVDQPHLSVSLMENDVDTGFKAEMVKFSPTARARPKSVFKKTPFLPVTGTKTPTADNRRYSGDDKEWARMTHFNFAPGITLVT